MVFFVINANVHDCRYSKLLVDFHCMVFFCLTFLCVLSYRFSRSIFVLKFEYLTPLSLHSDLSEISHCSIRGLSVREVMRIENMTTKVKFS